jgi:hypothetical protein
MERNDLPLLRRKSFHFLHNHQGGGLPDGILSSQKSHFGYILEGLVMKDVGICCGLLVYFTDER